MQPAMLGFPRKIKPVHEVRRGPAVPRSAVVCLVSLVNKNVEKATSGLNISSCRVSTFSARSFVFAPTNRQGNLRSEKCRKIRGRIYLGLERHLRGLKASEKNILAWHKCEILPWTIGVALRYTRERDMKLGIYNRCAAYCS